MKLCLPMKARSLAKSQLSRRGAVPGRELRAEGSRRGAAAPAGICSRWLSPFQKTAPKIGSPGIWTVAGGRPGAAPVRGGFSQGGKMYLKNLEDG